MLHVKFPLLPRKTAQEGGGVTVTKPLMSEGTIPGKEATPGKGLRVTHLESKENEGTECEGKGEERHGLSSQKQGAIDKVHLS